ncbi:hypothetical protein BJF93_23665 [Xaviernesmea oryzae]|uniref:NIDO domain-containing protein n=1 Tax=Xaviernesmea oryzae TaxID=464029 RepID=A0A1Q9B2W4_9HYPH|nr:nidogen-like domain-containing protein [Xaviernesmea oryzae]OLP62356.1 hypothetical protein BJF93_23665 [Xaviernesmea oryzae]SEL98029.1 Hemolysin-type calcium-binding repeat-containing protein [Xaviernesmea oryzae]
MVDINNGSLDNTFAPIGSNTISANDDGSSNFIDVRSIFTGGINFFGHQFNGLYVNNNGNVTFGNSLYRYTPNDIGGDSNLSIIAPFWADVDTRGAGSLTHYGFDASRHSFIATWQNVDYYNATNADHQSKFDSFQLELVDQGHGDFDIIFRYNGINWVTGDASGGTNGLGGHVARAGFSAGDGVHYFELPQSGVESLMLGLDGIQGTAGTGVWRFAVRNGEVSGIGTTGNDDLHGTDGNDFLDGGAGNDRLDGGAGDDILYGGDGDDVVLGGAGNDTLIAGHGRGNDVYDGGADTDTITYMSTTQGVVVDLTAGTADGAEIDHDTLTGIENVVGGSGDDRIIGSNGDNELNGWRGADFIDGAGGRDTAIYSGNFADYQIQAITLDDGRAGYSVTGGSDGGDKLVNIEFARFNDGTYNFALQRLMPTQHTTPSAQADHYITAEDTPLVVAPVSGVLHNDNGAATIAASLVSGPQHGALSIDIDGGFIYKPFADYNGQDSFVYKAVDGGLNSDPVTVSIDITPVNDAPIAHADVGLKIPGSGKPFKIAAHSLLGNDDDGDPELAQPLKIVAVSGATHGKVELKGKDVYFTPTKGYSGPATFTYTVSDSDGATATGQVKLSVANKNGGYTLLGSQEADTIIGAKGNDKLVGSDGDDTLSGGLGNDVLTGGAGADRFVFNTKLDKAKNVDVITDFQSGLDHIVLDHTIFKKLTVGVLPDGAFASNVKGIAHEADDRILYNSKTGGLFYDADGSGKGAPVLFAKIAGHGVIDAHDFLIV